MSTATERPLASVSTVLSWRVYDGRLEPHRLIEILEAVHHHAYGVLPGSAITRIEFDGTDLKITLTEVSS